MMIREARSQWHQPAELVGILPLKGGCAIVFERIRSLVPAIALAPKNC